MADTTPLSQKDGEMLTPPGNKVYEVEEEMSKDIRQAPPTKFPPTMRVGDVSVQVKVPPQRKRPPLVHACGVWGIGIIWIRRLEINSADSDVDPERRRGKLGETQNPAGPVRPKEEV